MPSPVHHNDPFRSRLVTPECLFWLRVNDPTGEPVYAPFLEAIDSAGFDFFGACTEGSVVWLDLQDRSTGKQYEYSLTFRNKNKARRVKSALNKAAFSQPA